MGLLGKIVNFFVPDAAARRQFINEFNANALAGFNSSFIDTYWVTSTCEGNPSFRHNLSAPSVVSGLLVSAKGGRELTVEEVLLLGKIILANQSLVRRMYVLHWDTLIIYGGTGKSVSWAVRDFFNFGGLLNNPFA